MSDQWRQWRQRRAAELRELAACVESGECDALALVWRHAPTGQRLMHGSADMEEEGAQDVVCEMAGQLKDWLDFPHIIMGEA